MVAVALIQAVPALAQDAELDALNLQSAPEVAPRVAQGPKLFVEGAIGNASQRYLTSSRDIGRVSLDFSHSVRLSPTWRAVLSDRLDYIHPTEDGADATVNSLREAYLSWQPEGGNTALEFGRINLRHGPGYGYNPTDFFRDGSLRAVTSANPFARRENRLGTVMLRAQHLWSSGSLSAAYSPKLADRPSSNGWSADLGATNNRDRALIALSSQFSQRVSSQILAYKARGNSPTLGASATALLSDAAVAHVEWSRGSEPDMLSRALGAPGPATTRNRFTGGVSYTTLSKLSVTAEYQYNGFALSQSNWATLGATAPDAQVAYLLQAQRLQELAPRHAYLIYLTQKGVGIKDLDLTAFLRVNADDHSRMAWLELRRHWPSFDLAFQLQQHMGRITSEFGVLPDRRVLQVLGTYYF
ncbi:hypothetical protein [Rhodoferax sp.]|uniref:hypothetical protein n=1 Tax=Rhodoferax sp. TaxID=50421 RepID=UPI00276474F4|nr:hypothetical protein [Rhodoferax sp.]